MRTFIYFSHIVWQIAFMAITLILYLGVIWSVPRPQEFAFLQNFQCQDLWHVWYPEWHRVVLADLNDNVDRINNNNAVHCQLCGWMWALSYLIKAWIKDFMNFETCDKCVSWMITLVSVECWYCVLFWTCLDFVEQRSRHNWESRWEENKRNLCSYWWKETFNFYGWFQYAG